MKQKVQLGRPGCFHITRPREALTLDHRGILQGDAFFSHEARDSAHFFRLTDFCTELARRLVRLSKGFHE
jgi:hypothetical protein